MCRRTRVETLKPCMGNVLRTNSGAARPPKTKKRGLSMNEPDKRLQGEEPGDVGGSRTKSAARA